MSFRLMRGPRANEKNSLKDPSMKIATSSRIGRLAPLPYHHRRPYNEP